MRIIIIIIFLFLPFYASANDVYLKTGYVYKNVTIDTSGTLALVDLGNRIDTVQKSSILKNEHTPYHNLGSPRLVQMTQDESDSFLEPKPTVKAMPKIAKQGDVRQLPRTEAEQQRNTKLFYNARFITIGILGAVIAWDQFSMAEANNYDKKARTREYVVGAAAALVSLTFTVYALMPVSVSVSTDKINISYNF